MVKTLIDRIKEEAEITGSQTGRPEFSEAVYRAIEKTPRHLFVSRNLQAVAYENTPLPITCGQTISQPFIVALMTDLLDIKASDRVLEIGTGSGYQAAVLSHLAKDVYSVEIIEKLGREAKKRLETLHYKNVHTKIGDGSRGWTEEAPFDAIIITAAIAELPKALVDQLKDGGRLIYPEGEALEAQELVLLTKQSGGGFKKKSIIPVRFVPFRRE